MAIGNLEQRIKGNASGARGTYSKNREIPLDEMKRFWDWMTVKEDNNKTRHENIRSFVVSEIKRQGTKGNWGIFFRHCQGLLDQSLDIDILQVCDTKEDGAFDFYRSPQGLRSGSEVSDTGEEYDNVFLELTATVLRRSYLEKYDEEKAGPKGCKAYMMKMFAFTLGHYHQDFMSKYVARLGTELSHISKEDREQTVKSKKTLSIIPSHSELGWGEGTWSFETETGEVATTVKPTKRVVAVFHKVFPTRKA
jgi:hypothetical protein